MTASSLILDASVLINVLATRQAAAILCAFASVGVCSAVEQESTFLRADQPGDPPERISLHPLIADGLLQRYDLRSEEEDLFVNLAAELEDGEAMTMAIAHSRGLAAAVDDRKARRIAGERFPGLVLLRTSDILHAWNRAKRPPGDQLREAIRRIQAVARYRPGSDDPLHGWWTTAAL